MPALADSPLTIRGLRVRPVNVPMPRPLRTSGGEIRIAPLALIDLYTEQGVTGVTYLFCYTPLALKPVVQTLESIAPLIVGEVLEPLEIRRKLERRFRLLGVTGIVGMSMAGIDMAAWDALARAASMPLARMLGATPRAIPAYNSCGLGMIGVGEVGAEAAALQAPGFAAVKVRLGYADWRTDVQVVRAVREAVGDEAHVMADYNQSLGVAEAIRRITALDDEALDWVEEPTRADDVVGHARIRRAVTTPIQIGENWWGPQEMLRSVTAGASGLGMPDAMKIGGVSGWMKAAAVAEAEGMPLSSHLFPEVSAHLLAASPTAHWLEYVDWAAPVLEAPVVVSDGHVKAPETPGTGIDWNEEAVHRYLVQ